VSFALFSAFSDRRRMSDDLIASLLPREVSSRLAALLLNLAERFGEDDGTGAILIDVRLSHQELANMFASTREAVSKSINEFRRNGLLGGRTPKTIVLLNREALSDWAEGGVGR
jgi:CRP-like cAMP-binding protein